MHRIKLCLAILVFISICHLGFSQGYRQACAIHGRIFVEEKPQMANFRVYIEEDEYMADLIVFIENNELMTDQAGKWFYTPVRAFADFSIIFVENKTLADFSIYLTEIDVLAGCNQ